MTIQQKTVAGCLMTALSLVSAQGQAQPPRKLCPDSRIYVIADNNGDRKRVCKAVRVGTAFLKLIGLALSEKLIITLSRSLLPDGQVSALGQYNLRNNEIRLINYESVPAPSMKSPPAFRSSMSPAIWRSYVVYALVNAAAQDAFVARGPDRSASEYIAAVAQMATLSADEREGIIRKYPELSGFEEKEEIALAYYMLDQSQFTVRAYLHFSKPENGLKFINGLLEKDLPDD